MTKDLVGFSRVKSQFSFVVWVGKKHHGRPSQKLKGFTSVLFLTRIIQIHAAAGDVITDFPLFISFLFLVSVLSTSLAMTPGPRTLARDFIFCVLDKNEISSELVLA